MKFSLLLCSLCLCSQLSAASRSEYLKFLAKYEAVLGKNGNYREGQIEIISDAKRIKEIEELQKKRLIKKGMSEKLAQEASKVGIVAEDGYWVFIRDAVVFPTGAEGTYNRMIWKSSLSDGIPGAAVLPVLPNGDIILIVTYRHATRSWELEVPRGGKKEGEEIALAMKRELLEETGYQPIHYELLGYVTQDSGAVSSVMPVFFSVVEKMGSYNIDYSEAIAKILVVPLLDLQKMILEGSFELELKGKKEKIFVRDSFLTYALYLAGTKNLLSPAQKGALAT